MLLPGWSLWEEVFQTRALVITNGVQGTDAGQPRRIEDACRSGAVGHRSATACDVATEILAGSCDPQASVPKPRRACF